MREAMKDIGAVAMALVACVRAALALPIVFVAVLVLGIIAILDWHVLRSRLVNFRFGVERAAERVVRFVSPEVVDGGLIP